MEIKIIENTCDIESDVLVVNKFEEEKTTSEIANKYAVEEDDFKGFGFKAYLSNITSEKTLILKIYNKDKKELKKQEVKINYTPTTRLYTYNLAIDKKIKKEDVLYYSVEIKESE